jgi:hypothetical protein
MAPKHASVARFAFTRLLLRADEHASANAGAFVLEAFEM